MAQVSLPSPQILTSEERWRRWEQRGRDNDARFQRRAQAFLIGAALILATSMVFALLLE